MTAKQLQPEVPDFKQRQAMWAAIGFDRVTSAFPAVEAYLNEMRALYANGKVEHAAFVFSNHPIFDWFASRNQYHEMGFFEEFWKTSGPKAVFPYLLRDLNFYDQKYFSFASAFQLGGTLAWILSAGGAYNRFERGGIEAKRLGEAAATEMLAGSYDDALVFQCGAAWSDFFFEVAWDATFLVIDPKRRIVHALLATDTD
jgi:hypothetical protein